MSNEQKLKTVNATLAKIKGLSAIDQKSIEEQLEKQFHRATFWAEYRGKKAVVRIIINELPSDEFIYNNEINSLIELEKNGFEGCPKLLEYNPKEKWVIQSFLEGESAGNSYLFKDDFMRLISPLKVFKLIQAYKSFQPSLRDGIIPTIEFYDRILIHFQHHWPTTDFSILERWNAFYHKVVKKEIEKHRYFSHGDLNPGNIIFSQDKLSGIIDWELARLDSYYRDFACVYCSAYKNPEWQNEFYQSLALSEEDKRTFDFFVFFYHADNVANLHKIISEGRSELHRSGKLEKKDAESMLEDNFSRLNKISFN